MKLTSSNAICGILFWSTFFFYLLEFLLTFFKNVSKEFLVLEPPLRPIPNSINPIFFFQFFPIFSSFEYLVKSYDDF